jgi:PleD family two-component response regulator
LAERIEVLERAEQSLQVVKLNPEQRDRAIEEAHRLAGGLGTFGYIQGSELARAIEFLLIEENPLDERLSNQFSYLFTELRQLLPSQREQLQPANQQAAIDTLTPIANRCYFDEFFEWEWDQHFHERAFLSLILCAIDQAQTDNGRVGQYPENAGLQSIDQIIRNCIHANHDLAARDANALRW